ncbi:PTS lactose/cellobiose transporter subunit IIA [uncultured Faecalibaculum sp.]|uniref:PTS lactose/cellobiose transporter subunit IIA n=1 Tax=uncultured Faecalibaculum sp. TaxID=1729681 RepID=UPI0025E1A60B|nr:PTS lactose/cellobiose transporter subunit IIA [uncultured Faecalibaculum sp.]
MEGMELICFQIIAASGGAKSAFIAAIDAAKQGDFEEAASQMAAGEEYMNQGHEPHAQMIQKEAAGEPNPISLLLIHAEDQMMGAEQFKVLAQETIDLYKTLADLKK